MNNRIMINELIVKNFKSIGEDGIRVELKPLTIFLGPNGSGKSSILEAIGILSQSTEATNFQTVGNLVKIPQISNVFYKRSSENWLTFEVHIKANDTEINKLIEIFNNKASDDIQTATRKGDITYTLSYKWGTNEFNQSVMIGNNKIAKAKLIKVSEGSLNWKLEFPDKTSTIPMYGADKILKEEVFKDARPEERNIFSDIAIEIVKIMKSRLLNRVFLLSAVRGNTKFEAKDYNTLFQESLKILGVGSSGQYLIPVLSLIYSNREYEQTYEKINKWASKFGLSKFSAGWKGGDILGSGYVDDTLNAVLDLAMASHGSKQILSVITQLFWSDLGSIIMIEEPEISLHPDSQARLAELFAESISDGKQIIITTHSEFLPLTLSIPIQNGLLKTDDIAIYHVKKGEKGTVIERLELTSKGYVKGWIPSFAELEARLLKEWMETVPEE
ncbi:MAG: hypothetical protein D4R88_02045 [Methanosarcinales archaeon]|nr:MAG: hypothetical protein D4R88_02045 [Methanosarcinales archaeon]